MTATIRVEVLYATRERQWVVPLDLPAGTTVMQAIERSGLDLRIPGLVVDSASIGIFGRLVEPDTRLREGDRVEIYRPLIADPKLQRRDRARKSGQPR